MNRKILLNLIHTAGTSKLLRSRKQNSLTILSLHRISNERDYFFEPITPYNFEQLLKYVLKHYSVISFSDLPDIKKNSNKLPLILSFDDGYYDFYEYALPLLRKYNLPSNHNIVNECASHNMPIWTQRLNDIFNHSLQFSINLKFDLDKLDIGIRGYKMNWTAYYLDVFKRLLQMQRCSRLDIISRKEHELSLSMNHRMMNWDEIKECSENRVEIGSHTYTHDTISTVSDPCALHEEISRSKTEIEEKIGAPVTIIALPNGQGNASVNEFVEQAGFKHLLYVNDGVNSLASISDARLNVFDRIGLINESANEMALRTELFHAKIKKYV